MGNHVFHINFFFRFYDLFTADLHLLQADHFVSHEANKFNVLRRLAENPFFVINAFVVFLAQALLRRMALRHVHQLFVHSHEHAVIFESLTYFRRKRFGISFRG